jgi:hypothetical protein
MWVATSAIPYDEMWADDRIWLPHVLAGNRVDGWFLFDDDRMLDYRLEVVSREVRPEANGALAESPSPGERYVPQPNSEAPAPPRRGPSSGASTL